MIGKIDPNRAHLKDATGIYVRAYDGDKAGSFDIAQLDKDSLRNWLKSRGGDNPLAENTVAILLGHDHFEAKT